MGARAGTGACGEDEEIIAATRLTALCNIGLGLPEVMLRLDAGFGITMEPVPLVHEAGAGHGVTSGLRSEGVGCRNRDGLVGGASTWSMSSCGDSIRSRRRKW